MCNEMFVGMEQKFSDLTPEIKNKLANRTYLGFARGTLNASITTKAALYWYLFHGAAMEMDAI